MKNVMKTFLLGAATIGTTSCQNELQTVYDIDNDGNVVDSFITEYPQHMILNSVKWGDHHVTDTAGVVHTVNGKCKVQTLKI